MVMQNLNSLHSDRNFFIDAFKTPRVCLGRNLIWHLTHLTTFILRFVRVFYDSEDYVFLYNDRHGLILFMLQSKISIGAPSNDNSGALKEINHREYEQEPSNYEVNKQIYNFLPFSRPFNLSIILTGLPVDQDEFNVIKSNN